MQSIQENIIVELILDRKKNIYFPNGLLVCDTIKEFNLIAKEGEAPLLWLEAISYPNIAFVTLDPYLVLPEYQPEINPKDIHILNEPDQENLLILCIVSLGANNHKNHMTINLANPILINWKNSVGTQVYLKNKGSLKTNFPISKNEFGKKSAL